MGNAEMRVQIDCLSSRVFTLRSLLVSIHLEVPAFTSLDGNNLHPLTCTLQSLCRTRGMLSDLLWSSNLFRCSGSLHHSLARLSHRCHRQRRAVEGERLLQDLSRLSNYHRHHLGDCGMHDIPIWSRETQQRHHVGLDLVPPPYGIHNLLRTFRHLLHTRFVEE